ncbi:hypothetical protein RvY_08392 [Ramazzottius varieornatus]|uniref:G-protein coupled receptors family 1 profile domain-containing protein n=1 Tax=Ramazzottius varieornatus TaxID=947166 RepID=A0A1D1V5M5_RAMVA|nr:hypothetical protein RvY_08392 [Ramazzottius varieornatus]
MLTNESDSPFDNSTSSTVSNASSGNQTALGGGPHWTTTSYSTLIVQISALLTNASLVFLFAWNRSLVTAFTIYVLNLCVANILSSAFFTTLHLIDYLYAPIELPGVNWWLGDSWCTMYQYSEWLLSGSMVNAHALIALNRFWAVTFPNSYRLKQTKLAAAGICIAQWFYMHLCILPGILLDVYIYRLPVFTDIAQCHSGTDAPFEWQAAIQLLIFDFPLVIIVGVLPVVYYKASRRRKPLVTPSTGILPTGLSGGPAAGSVSAANPVNAPTRIKSSGILAMTLMTATVLVCYVPDNLYNTLWVFNLDLGSQFYQIVTVLYELTPVFDPIWFILTLPRLRHAFLETYCSPCK